MHRSLLPLATVALLSLHLPLPAQTPQEVRRAFANIRSDENPNNGCEAAAWLYRHRATLKDQLLAEMYRSDRQGRDALLIVLFRTESFVPDPRFVRFVVTRLAEQNKYVGNNDLNAPAAGELQDDHTEGAHHLAWKFIEGHLDLFEPLLLEQIGRTADLWVVWSTAWVWKKRGLLERRTAVFTPEVLARIAANLRNDNTEFNASWAARLFLLLGNQGLPALRTAATSTDAQQSSLAKALIDAITKGNRRAFGYLSSKVGLAVAPYGPKTRDPEWLDEPLTYYMDRETYP